MAQDLQAQFAALAKELEEGKGGPVRFLKAGDNKIRLILEPKTSPVDFAVETYSLYQGRKSKKYLMFGMIFQSGDTVAEDDEKLVVRPILVPKKVYQSIVNTAAKGYDLFSPEEGLGIIITKTGSGLQTGYEVLPSPKPIPVDLKAIKPPEKSLLEYAKEFANFQENRSSGGQPQQAEASLEADDSGW